MGKVLLMNDVHVGHSTVPEFEANWSEAMDVCVINNIKELIIGGDLFQSRSSQTLDVLMSIRKSLMQAASMGIHVTLSNGNHCKVNQESNEGYCHVFSEYPQVSVIDDFMSLKVSDSVYIHTIAYFPETGSFTQKYQSLLNSVDMSKTNILYLHAGINGALASASDKELPAKMFDAFSAVLVGHYHNRCHIEGTNIYYVGSSRQFNFGEDEFKGYTLVNEDGSFEYIDNKVNSRYTTMELSFRKWNHPDTIAKLNQHKKDGAYRVRVRVNCKQEEASSVDKKLLLEAGASKVEIQVTDMQVIESPSSSLFTKLDNHQLASTYEEFCSEKGFSDIDLGINYLSKINMSCGD